MTTSTHNIPHFNSFVKPIQQHELPNSFTLLLSDKTHPICLLAAQELQYYLSNQTDWEHNFGLSTNKADGAIIGKMFGVLIVTTPTNDIGYLTAFSGKLAGANHHSKFVPPVFDSLTENSFLTSGMLALDIMSNEINTIKESKSIDDSNIIKQLKIARKQYSAALQKKLFDHYFFVNSALESKSVYELFDSAKYKNPPSGAGECATPKLLQYAFKNNLKPLAIAEFWWGKSPKSTHWKHGHFYPCCKEKCEPILAHMLKGIDSVFS